MIFIFKLFLCLLLTPIIGVGVIIVLLNFELNWQVVLYLLTALIVYVGMLYIVFAKTSKKANAKMLVNFIIHCFFSRMLPYIKHAIDVDACIDSGICSEKKCK